GVPPQALPSPVSVPRPAPRPCLAAPLRPCPCLPLPLPLPCMLSLSAQQRADPDCADCSFRSRPRSIIGDQISPNLPQYSIPIKNLWSFAPIGRPHPNGPVAPLSSTIDRVPGLYSLGFSRSDIQGVTRIGPSRGIMSLPPPSLIKAIAHSNGYVERRDEASSTLFFKDNQPHYPTLINVFYTTGGVMTKLSHPRSGYNELWRSDAYNSATSLATIFANPRVHTGQGYRHASGAARGCAQCGMQKKKCDYSKNQWRKGPGNAKCSSCIQQSQLDQQTHGGQVDTNNLQPSNIVWNAINDSITCDAEGCVRTSPTIWCQCPAPVYYCSESCKRRHQLVHSEDCRDLEMFRRLCHGQDPNLNSGLCNAHPSTLSQMRGHAMATQLSGRGTVEALLLQAESIHQADGQWKHAIALYQRVLMMGGDSGQYLSPSQCRQAFMGLSRCFYEIGLYDKAIHAATAAIEMNRHFPHIHKYLALSHLASGNRAMAIKTIKHAVLYEAPWSDETVQSNKELLCELLNGQNQSQTIHGVSLFAVRGR
ncbi:hypothetical protein ACHAWF_014309, partial [Thalassiosira exigua]